MTLAKTQRISLQAHGDVGWWAAQLLTDLGFEVERHAFAAGLPESCAWRDAGLAQINACHEPPLAIASAADGVIAALQAISATPIDVCGRRLLGMRLLSHELATAGRISANGSCHLLRCRDGEVAVNLPRNEDWDMIPAWLETDAVADWDTLAQILLDRTQSEVLERARLLGLAVAPVREAQATDWFHCQQFAPPAKSVGRAFRVLDMSQLWAGPLCGYLLQRAGAQVTKLESPIRPDGALAGPISFYSALNRGKTIVQLDLSRASGREQFLAMLNDFDLVIESSRPRALEHFGLFAERLVRPGLSWLSLTGYGRQSPMRDWVAYGDDAAVAGGLAMTMQRVSGKTQFCGDAIADPLAGLHAALLAQSAMQQGGGCLLSVALQDVVSNLIYRFDQRGIHAEEGDTPAN